MIYFIDSKFISRVETLQDIFIFDFKKFSH